MGSRLGAEFTQGVTAIVHGEVTGRQACTSDDGQQAWTFVTIDVEEVLLGSIADPGGTITLRLPFGTFPDGTVGAIVGVPSMGLGDEVVVSLNGRGEPDALTPILPFAESVQRIVPTIADGVVGHSVVYSTQGLLWSNTSLGPVRGPLGVSGAVARGGGDDVNVAEIASIAEDYGSERIAPILSGRADATWIGYATVTRVSHDPFIKVEPLDCEMRLDGQGSVGTALLTGRCTPPRGRSVRLRLDLLDLGGAAPFAAIDVDGEYDTMALQAGSSDFVSGFSLVSGGTLLVDVRARQVNGLRPTTRDEFLDAVRAHIAASGATGASVRSLPRSVASCSMSPITAQPFVEAP